MLELLTEIYPLILYMIAGLAVGVLAGLLPALPVYTGPFLLLQFHTGMALEELLVFWMTVAAGAQYFGSVAVITTNVPGEESALVYIDDLKKFDLVQKNYLLYDTALGSTIAALIATAFMWTIVSFSGMGELPFFYSVKTMAVVYAILMVSFLFINKKKWFLVLLTMIFGVSIAPQSNYALPPLWYDWTYLFEGWTFYLIILGTLIIPNMFSYDVNLGDHSDDGHWKAKSDRQFTWWLSLKATVVGILAGLIPGPSAEVSAITAYKTLGKNSRQKIIAAETANNAAVIVSVIPFFVLSLPVNNNTLLMSGIMDMHGLTISEAILGQSMIPGLTVINLVTLVLLFSIGLFYVLSTRLIDFYVKIIVLLHGKINMVLITIVSALIYIDLLSAEVTVPHYFILLTCFTALGFALRKFNISAIPLMFSILLGDKLIWTVMQVSRLYL